MKKRARKSISVPKRHCPYHVSRVLLFRHAVGLQDGTSIWLLTAPILPGDGRIFRRTFRSSARGSLTKPPFDARLLAEAQGKTTPGQDLDDERWRIIAKRLLVGPGR